jgi:hypothetical protein
MKAISLCLLCACALAKTALSSHAQAPAIVGQPASHVVTAGAPVTLSVDATGSEPISYLWFKNGRSLGTQINRSLVLPSASAKDSGSYTVLVRNKLGFVMSAVARLEVNNPVPTILPIDLSGWNEDVILENSSVPMATAPFSPPAVESNGGTYWFESGLGGHPDGLPALGYFTSVVNTNALFKLQPYTGNNALILLRDTNATSAVETLRLAAPAPYRSISLLAVSSDANSARFALKFDDNTVVTNLMLRALDWRLTDNGTEAVAGLGVYRTVVGYNTTGTIGVGMSETDIDLVARGLDKKRLVALDFNRPADRSLVGVFAVSGAANIVPTLTVSLPGDLHALLTVTGFPRTSYRIEYTTDLKTWRPLASIASPSGVSQFADYPMDGTRFYRVTANTVK